MEFTLPALIGISLAAMFFGYFFGLFEGRGQGYKRGRKEEAAAHSILEAAAGSAATKATRSEPPSALALRIDDSGQPMLSMDGQPVHAADVSPTARRRLIDLIALLRPWIDPGAVPSRSPALATSTVAPVEVRAAPPPGGVPAAPGPQPAKPGGTPAQPVPTGPLSLVQQIDSILQERLAGTPLAGRGIRLAEALHGGAIVFIGQQQYEGVEKVPDGEVQAAIRAAIADWEKRFTPG